MNKIILSSLIILSFNFSNAGAVDPNSIYKRNGIPLSALNYDKQKDKKRSKQNYICTDIKTKRIFHVKLNKSDLNKPNPDGVIILMLGIISGGLLGFITDIHHMVSMRTYLFMLTGGSMFYGFHYFIETNMPTEDKQQILISFKEGIENNMDKQYIETNCEIYQN